MGFFVKCIKMKTPKGLFIGLNTLDVQFLVEEYPKQNQKAKASEYGFYTGGPATNASIAFAHLSGDAHLLSSFGSHPLTHFTYEDLHSLSLKTTDFTPNRTSHPIFASVITTKNSGDRAIVSYHPNNLDYCSKTLDEFPSNDFDIILLDSFYIDAAKSIVNSNKKATVVLDGGSWKKGLDKLLPYVDIAICSADFFPPGTSTSEEVVAYLVKLGIANIVITKGNQPMLVQENGNSYGLEVEKIKAVDTLGAGDVFHGAFCFYYANSRDFKQALRNASKIAAKSCLHYGTRKWMQ